MEASYKLGRIKGIEIGIHYSWLIIFALLTYSLAESFFPSIYGNWTTGQYWIIGLIASLLLFASVLAHELGHSFVAIAKGIPVHNITLFIFGGVASLSQDVEDAKSEFLIAIAGPAVSLLIAVVAFGGRYLTRGVNEQLSAVFDYLMFANGLLVVFNLIPGFPLDGGRVFRSIVWGITNSMERATRIATTLGVIIGYLFIAVGVFVVFEGDLISGIWFGAIGWFLQTAAGQSMQQFRAQSSVQNVQVGMLMDPSPSIVDPGLTLDDLVEHHIIGRNARGVPVVQQGILLGIISPTDLKLSPRADWSTLRVADRMTPRHRLATLPPDAPIQLAMHVMSEMDIQQIPVVHDRLLVGLLTRDAVMRFVQMGGQNPTARKA
ncbi:MAG TPA: site-2 protease family protein [Nitrolancea sp.]|nr:site-2 protease family protein [Nitrolancea sp.]